jgi:Ni/Fe-hydrogenase subunit HybB-like protein
MNWHERLASGKFWMGFWLVVFASSAVWGLVTVLSPLLNSTANLNILSIVALLLAAAAGFQSTLSMRKADDADDF